MKKIVLILLFFVAVIGYSQNKKQDRKNLAIVEQYIKYVQDLNSDGMNQLLAEDYIGYGPSYDHSINKIDAIKNWKEATLNLYKSIKYDKFRNYAIYVPDGDDKGNWVTSWAELTITYKENNAEVVIWTNTLYQMVNGKIVKSYTLYNEADVLGQLGYIFIKNEK